MSKHGVVKKFDKPIKLKSGKESNIYINWRGITHSVSLTYTLALHITDVINTYFPECECIYGVPEGATKLALISQFLLAKPYEKSTKKNEYPLAMGRAKEKIHGDPKDKYFIGEPLGNIIVIEDVVTTGQSLFNCLDQLKKQKKNVIAVMVLTDRSENNVIAEELNKRSITYYPLTRLQDL